MATTAEWEQRLEEWNDTPGYRGKDLERVVVLTPVEAAVLAQLDGKPLNDKGAQEDQRRIMKVLAKKYGFVSELEERRAIRWVLDGQVAIFKKGWPQVITGCGGELVKSEEGAEK